MRLAFSVDIASPQKIGGPASYGRTPADAANLLAAALAPHGGVVLYRAFVYNHHLDWHNPKADRARAAYDIFHPLDGKFAPNVIVQTKEGPIDFQTGEPVSPLFGGLTQTSQAMELQITQDYTGQQRHLVYLAPNAPEISAVQQAPSGPSADVRIQVEPGALYTFGDITFEDAKAFAPDELRRQFPSRLGELYSETKISKGLNNLRDLYVQKGYANFGVIPRPRIDESRHIVSFMIDCDEGRPVSFDNLRLDGKVAGAGQSPLASWKRNAGQVI